VSLQTTLQTLLTALAPAHQDIAPPGQSAPYIVWLEVVTPINNTLAGASDLQNTRLQIDAYGATQALRKTLADAIVAALAAAAAAGTLRNVAVSRQNMPDPDTRLFRTLLEFSVWSAG
jgi:hypothetical protein